MDVFKNFINLFLEVWNEGILGIDIFQTLIGLGIFLIFLLFRGLIGKYSLVDVMTQTNLMCISKKASKVLEFIKWKKVIFFNPGEEEFFLNKIN